LPPRTLRIDRIIPVFSTILDYHLAAFMEMSAAA